MRSDVASGLPLAGTPTLIRPCSGLSTPALGPPTTARPPAAGCYSPMRTKTRLVAGWQLPCE